MSKNLHQMTNEILQTFKEYERTGTKPWTYRTAAFDLSYQIGMLTKRILQLDGERYREGKNDKELKVLIADELADIIADVLLIAHELDIDLEMAWKHMQKSDAKKIAERSRPSNAA